jgi:GNAT superfamily N-acetyltransferase
MSAADVLRILPGWTKAIGWRELFRAKRGVDSLEKVHPHKQHFYLPFVGVAPESQGRGLGTALMGPVLEKCDREGYLPIWRRPVSAAEGATSGSAFRLVRKNASLGTAHRFSRCGGTRRANRRRDFRFRVSGLSTSVPVGG